ncbi:hypothetical protein FH972_014564 [Carpinus fangiana]|uniref:Uncharacterized protein n=1 Tax=Carpinus fangiana TaxID=176857 RepID=A0A5N6RDR4_9ROSI|nr:hypothetical protein FH972_014564 [Carpinus fangiana]
MGCCVSTSKSKSHPDLKTGSTTRQQFPTKSPIEKPDPTHVRDQRAPPPVEEESVKEVLSETPIVPKPQNPIPAEEKKTQVPLVETEGLNLIHKTEQELSEASQITESLSYSTATTTTTTITEMKEEEDEAVSKRSRLNRAEARGPRKRPYTGELSGRRNIPARGPSEVRTRRLNAGTRKDSGEGSFRRSRSPATRKPGGVGRSPGKVAGAAGSRSVDLGVQRQSKQRAGVEEEEKSTPNDDVLQQQQGNESIENPLVSLECFIFL